MTATPSTLITVLTTLLRPAARFCLRHGLHIQDLLEAAKAVFLEVCAEELRAKGEKANTSRLSAATGIHRRDVMRITERGELKEQPQGLISRVLGQWQHDRRFTTSAGKPRQLSLSDDNNEFRKLILAVSQDLNPGTLLFELERLGAVERRGNRLILKAQAYVPRNDWKEGYRMLARDSSYLSNAVEQNVHEQAEEPNLHATTELDNIRLDEVPRIRQWLLEEGSKFHNRVRAYLSRFDLDLNPRGRNAQGGAKVVFSCFSFTEGGSHEHEKLAS